MMYDIYQIQWGKLKSQVRKHWSKLTEEDLTRLTIGNEDLIVILRRRYGYGKAQAEIEIVKWLQDVFPHSEY